MSILSEFLESVNFLTVFKFKNKKYAGVTQTELLIKSIKYFPAAGLFIGIATAFVFYVFNKFLPLYPSALISIFCLYAVTGGLHFDGLSDTSDGFFAYLKSGDRNRFYKAMKDVNAGAAGNIAVIFYVLIMWSLIISANQTYSLYASMPPFLALKHFTGIFSFLDFKFNFVYLVLLLFPAAGRYSIVVASYFSETPENFKGIGTVFTEGTDTKTFLFASFIAFLIICLLSGLAGFFSILITILAVFLISLYFRKKFGGVNGDMIGFTVKLSELVFVAALLGFHKALY
jgi:adenosylcobinamide-GDP ribazoletransferase